MSRESFEKWRNEQPNQRYGTPVYEAWQAACDYQRERDVKLCDDKAACMWAWWDSRADPTDQGQAMAADDLSELIRANKGE